MSLVIETDDRAVLRLAEMSAVMPVLPLIEGRRSWLKGGGLSFVPSLHNIEKISETIPHLNVVDKRPKSGEVEANDIFFEVSSRTVDFLTQPYPHQIEALNAIRDNRTFALFMEQGTGKSKVFIDWAAQLWASGKITGIFVTSKRGVHEQWIEQQFATHSPVRFDAIAWASNRKEPDLREMGPGDRLKVFTMNIDAVRTKRGYRKAEEFLSLHSGKAVIGADESQDIKNAQSARHKAMMKLKPYAPFRMLLTGTPIAKDLTDEWAQLRWLNEDILGIRYARAFQNEYCIMGGFEGREVIGHRNVSRFRERTAPFVFRKEKKDIGILPPAFEDWTFDLTKDQKAKIREMKKTLEVQLDSGEITAATGAVAIQKIQQISNGFIIDTEAGETHRLMELDKNPRLIAALDWVASREGKLLIWARFREDLRMLAEALESARETFVQYHGGTPPEERKANVAAWLEPEGPRIFLSNPASAGTGQNLQGLCNSVLYYSNSHNAIERWQSQDRVHRIGTNGIVTYTDLLARGSVDYAIARSLKAKKSISDMALNDLQSLIREINL